MAWNPVRRVAINLIRQKIRGLNYCRKLISVYLFSNLPESVPIKEIGGEERGKINFITKKSNLCHNCQAHSIDKLIISN